MSDPSHHWRQRVLVTSTLDDMGAEREHLHKIVFPELERRLVETRGQAEGTEVRIEVEPVDVRWKIQTGKVGADEGNELLVLLFGFGELLETEPFQVVLLGDCYGRVPPEERAKAVLEELGFRTDVAGKSVTALEIEFSVLNRPLHQERCFFYFRDPLPYHQMPPELAARYCDARHPDPQVRAGAERLIALKGQIERDMSARVRRYSAQWDAESRTVTGLDDFGRMVREDLWRALGKEMESEIRRKSSRPFDVFISHRRAFRDVEPKPPAPEAEPAPAAEEPTASPDYEIGAASKWEEDSEATGLGPLGRAELRSEVRQPSPEPPRALDENVQFSVYRPGTVQPERWYPLLAFAHLAERRPDALADEPDPIQEVQRQARRVLELLQEDPDEYEKLIGVDSLHPVPQEGEISFVPEIWGVRFNPPSRSFLWERDESVHREEFRLRASAALDGQTARGRLTVFLGSRILAEVPLVIRVDRAYGAEPHASPSDFAFGRPYRKIFASYSHQDVQIVEEFERFFKTVGDEYLRDWIHLRAGEVWCERLEELIREADIFQLFWSTRSMRSRFVRQEWEYALGLGRPHFVRPVYWEDPMPNDPAENLPPEELLRLHFQQLPRGGGPHAPPLAPPSEKDHEAKKVPGAEPDITAAQAMEPDVQTSSTRRMPTPAASPDSAPPAFATEEQSMEPAWASEEPSEGAMIEAEADKQRPTSTTEAIDYEEDSLEPSVVIPGLGPSPDAPSRPTPRRAAFPWWFWMLLGGVAIAGLWIGWRLTW